MRKNHASSGKICATALDLGFPSASVPSARRTEERETTPFPANPSSQLSTDASAEDRFADFWAAYPRKVARKQALDAWKKTTSKIVKNPSEIAQIIMAAKRYTVDKSGVNPRFIAHAATWLNGERWRDPVESAVPERQKPADLWEIRLRLYVPGGFWSGPWGARPESDGPHDCPLELVNRWRVLYGLPPIADPEAQRLADLPMSG